MKNINENDIQIATIMNPKSSIDRLSNVHDGPIQTMDWISIQSCSNIKRLGEAEAKKAGNLDIWWCYSPHQRKVMLGKWCDTTSSLADL